MILHIRWSEVPYLRSYIIFSITIHKYSQNYSMYVCEASPSMRKLGLCAQNTSVYIKLNVSALLLDKL